jgi:hypothetical protein
MSSFHRNTTRTARKTLKRKCSFSGLPIEAGDRYVEYAGKCDGVFTSLVWLETAGSVFMLSEVEEFYLPCYWEFWVDSLNAFLRTIGCDEEMIEICGAAARDYEKLKTKEGS